MFLFRQLLILVFVSVSVCFTKAAIIIDEVNLPCTDFAIAELKQQIGRDYSNLSISVSISSESQKEQSFEIQNKGNLIQVVGGDRVGAMYGVLELAETLKLGTKLNEIKSLKRAAFINKRGIKINIPLDSRLPSYDDTGDAAQLNISEMWNWGFWTEYLDSLARNRYNLISFWSKHPFPTLIQMDDYPDVALDDVYAWAGELNPDINKDWKDYDLSDMTNHKLVKKISIEDKIRFWQNVMQYAHDRGIEIFFFTWNIYVTGAEKYGIKPTSEEAVSYMRDCVKEFVETYPHVTGMGVTAGESMGATVKHRTNVEWLRDTYGMGIQDAIRGTDRDFRFIFRRHHTNLEAIDRDFTPHFEGNVETSFKYSFAHLYSTATPPRFDKEYAKDVEKYGYKCWMNLRNDDIFTFRWGDPDFVRTYWTKMMTYPVAGFYMGSDGYVWGREFTSKIPKLSGVLEVEKHWYREMLWGRLAYDPSLSDRFIKQKIQHRFSNVDAELLFDVWKEASKIIPAVTNFHWQGGDSMWSIEGCTSMNGFHSIRDFVNCYTFEDAKIMNIPDYVHLVNEDSDDTRITPLQVAESVSEYSDRSLEILDELNQSSSVYTAELIDTLADLEAMAYLGSYYANKIRGATFLHLHENSEKPSQNNYQEQALAALKEALSDWEKYADNASARYRVQLLARTKYLDWNALKADVVNDIRIVEGSTGKEPKVAKVFYRQHLRSHPEIKEVLKENLLSLGYDYRELPAWMLHGHAVGKRITISTIGNLSHEEFVNWGGQLPSDFEKKGYGFVHHHDIDWILGTDETNTAKALDEYCKINLK